MGGGVKYFIMAQKIVGNLRRFTTWPSSKYFELEVPEWKKGCQGVRNIKTSDKIADLDFRRQSLIKQLAELAADEVSPQRMIRIGEFLDEWENICMENRREVIDNLIGKIIATHENVDIQWKI